MTISAKMENKTYFEAGDCVRLKQDIPNRPVMIVVRKETSLFKHGTGKRSVLIGIRCRWFTTTGELQEAVFNTKDLTLV